MTAERDRSPLAGRWVPRPWGRLWLWRAGRGPVVVALHGLGASGRYWEGLARALGDRFTVLAPDLGGFGRSDKPALAYDRRFHLDNLDAVVAAGGAGGPTALVGHSMGGVVAGLWAAKRPERVSGLALVATPFPADQGGPGHRYGADGFTARQRGAFRAAQLLWPVLTAPVRSRTFPRAVVSDFLRHTPASYWGSARDLLWDGGAAAELAGLCRLAAPALLVSGAGDTRVPSADVERWAALLPGARRQVVAGGHQLLLRSGFQAVADWLADLPA
ncbi:MAG: alpha/beta hydrolase [Actinobacteria bacterium]|nr:alpha/beta hydrolase [Actinomycetota bacterium]